MEKLSFQLVGLLCEHLEINQVINYLYFFCKLSKEDIAQFGFDLLEIEEAIAKERDWNIF